jgi:hypothetical protein
MWQCVCGSKEVGGGAKVLLFLNWLFNDAFDVDFMKQLKL